MFKQTGAAIMLSHVVAETLDADHPASQSKAVIDGLLRGAWGFEGLAITDDLNMSAVYYHALCGGLVASLNAGVDLLLVSYDGRQYYRMMACLLSAHSNGTLDHAMLEASARRLATMQ
jgi:beta-N-acetylhexosaminidase